MENQTFIFHHPVFVGLYPGKKPGSKIYVFKIAEKYYSCIADRVSIGSVNLRCRKYRREKCKFRVKLKTVNIHDPENPAYFDASNFSVVPSLYIHTCLGHNYKNLMLTNL